MKLLRILTGHHAGAQVVLDAGTHRIGTDDDADIQLTDWRGADVLLVVEPNGAVSSQRLDTATTGATDIADTAGLSTPPAEPADSGGEAAPDAAPGEASAGTQSLQNMQDTQAGPLDPGKVWMVDFVPMQFDDTVLCVGWANVTWPSDLALLSTLLTGPAEAKREADNAERDAARMKRRRYTGIAAACVAISAGAIGISFALTTNVSRAALSPPDALLEERVNRALSDAHLVELHAARDGTGGSDGTARAVVTGMVRSASEDYIARHVFERMKPGVITRRYRVADDTARGIRDAIGVDGVQVTYDGHGVFTVSGAVADRQRVENALTRVRGDFDKSIAQIRVALTDVSRPAPTAPQGTFTALVSSGDVQYAETPDGVKHIYAPPEAETETAAPGAASAATAAVAGPVPLPSDDSMAAQQPH